MTSNHWQPGVEVDGFRLIEAVHEGGMGRLFRVSKSGTTLPLVMKVPRLGSEQGSEAIVGFQTEVAIVPTLSGPHVPTFVAAGDLAAAPYLVMEWIDGECLEDVIGHGRSSPAELVRVGAALADALHSIHVQQVIHLDFKPAN